MYSVDAQKTYTKLYSEAMEKLAATYEVRSADEPTKEEVDNETSSTCR